MINSIEIEKSLKRYIKSKKIGYTSSLLVGFLITGDIILAEDVHLLQEKIEKNNKRIEEIDKEIFELLREGDYYAKTLEDNKQFFFPIDFEHRHSKSGIAMKVPVPGMDIVPPGKPGGPTETIPGLDIIPPGKPGGPTTTIPGKPILPAKPKPTIPNRVEVLKDPIKPNLPTNIAGNTDVEHSPLKDIIDKVIEPLTIKVDDNLVVPDIKGNELEKLNLNIGKIEIGSYVNTEVKQDDTVPLTESGFRIEPFVEHYKYEPRQATLPTDFNVKDPKAPGEIKLPDLNISTTGFNQGTGGIVNKKFIPNDKDDFTQVVVENYGKYYTSGEGISVTFKDTDKTDGSDKKNNTITYGGVSEGNFHLDTVEADKLNNQNNADKTGTVNQELVNNDLRTEFYDSRKNGSVYGETAAFISNTMGKDSSVEGKYNIKYDGSTWKNGTRIFLSVNSAGLNWQAENSYDNIGTVNGDKVGDKGNQAETTKAIVTEVKKGTTINLENNIEDGKNYGTLVGIDHQLWDMRDENNKGTSTNEYRKSYSIAKNSGTINLGKENGNDKKLVGISIETEQDHLTRHKLHNHVTLNDGVININGKESIGIGFENGGKVADDLYVGNVNFGANSGSSYGVRLKNSKLGDNAQDTKIQYNSVRVFGSVSDNATLGTTEEGKDLNLENKIQDDKTFKKIAVNGSGNGGFVVGKSLSDSATGYLKKDFSSGDGDDMPGYTGVKKDDYIGRFNSDLGKDFAGFEKGKVNPIANIHGLNIEVNGKNSVGFLRHKDYSTNNKNDMIITNETTGAIKNIDFGEGASDSVLIRSDMYGIDVQKDLAINGDGVGENKSKNAQTQPADAPKNIVLQATKTTWEKDGKKVNSVGHIINSGNLSGSMDNLVGMMANSSKDYDENATKLDETWKKDKAEIVNKGTISLTGKNAIGMAVLGANKGTLENGKVSTTYTSKTPNTENVDNISIYNDGEFNIKNSTVETSGKGSVAIFNTGNMTLTAEQNKNNIINANDGAVALYGEGGTLTSTGNLTINSNKNGVGAYAKDGANINITGGTFNIKEGSAGLASMGTAQNTNNKALKDDTNITLDNSTLNYSGTGYALYTKNDGTINIKNSTINLDGNAFGMEVELTKDGNNKNNITIDDKSKIKVKSNGVTVFNIVSTDEKKFSSNLSKLEENIGTALGSNKDLINKIEADAGVDLWKTAMVDGGTFTIDKNIYQDGEKAKNDATLNKDEKNLGEFYYKRFLGVRLNTTLNEGVTADATINGDTANKFFDGKVTGLEIVSSSKAKGLDDTSVTLKNGSKVVANRTDDGKDGVKNDATVGIFSNFAKVNLEEGSKIEVEKSTGANDKSYNGIGIFAANGSKVDINKATIEVNGNNSVGIYGLASRIDKDGNTLDGEYKDKDGKEIAGQGSIDITNKGTIDVSGGLGNIGIYADNNRTDKNNTDSKVTNIGTVKVGKSEISKDGKINSSVGIYASKSVIDNQGVVEVGEGNVENGVKYGGVGIYATNNSVIKNLGTLKLGSYATGAVIDASSELEDTTDLTFEKDKNSQDKGLEKIGIAFNNDDGTENGRVRDLNIKITANGISGLRAVATSGGTLNVNKDITLGDNNNRGIIATDGVIDNKATINIEKDTNTPSKDKQSSSALVAINKGATVKNNGEINLNGEKSIGISLSNGNTKSPKDGLNKIEKVGKINLNGEGNTGVYVNKYGKTSTETLDFVDLKSFVEEINFGEKAKYSTALYAKDSDIKIKANDEIEKTLYNSNAIVKAFDGSIVENNGSITVNSLANDKPEDKSVGIVLDTTSNYKGDGTIGVKGNAIGLFSQVFGDKKFSSNLHLDVDSQDKNGIGLALKGFDKDPNGKEVINQNNVALGGTVKINLKDSVGKVLNKGIGILANNVNLAFKDIELNYGNEISNKEKSSGVGVYLDNNSSLIGDLLYIGGDAKGYNKDEYSVGVYASSNSGNKNSKLPDVSIKEMIIDKEKSIGIYNAKDSLKVDGTIEVAKADSVGIFNGEGKTLEYLGGTINVTEETGEDQASVGISSKANSKVINSGNIITGSSRDVGIYGEDSEVINNGHIKANEGIGVYLVGDKSKYTAGEKGIISTGKGDSSETAIYLANNAKIEKGNLNLDLGAKDVGVYVGRTSDYELSKELTLDGVNLDISKSTGAYGIAVEENSRITNTNIDLNKDNIGLVGLGGNLNIDRVNINSIKGSQGNNTGIFLKTDENKKTHNTISNSILNLDKSLGIVLEASGENNRATLDLNDVKINLNNNANEPNKSGVFVGANNILNSDGSEFKITNDVGIFGKEGSTINFNSGVIEISGKSTGIYSNGGTVITDKYSMILNENKENQVDGGAIFVKNGNIQNGATIAGYGDNFYGLHLEGDGNIQNSGTIVLWGENTIGISQIGMIGNENNQIENTGDISVIGNETNENTSIGIYGKNTNVKNDGAITARFNTIGIYWDNLQNKISQTLESMGSINLEGKNAIGALLKGNASKVLINEIKDGEFNNSKEGYQMGIQAKDFESSDFTVNNIHLNDTSMGIYTENSNAVMNLGSVTIGDGAVKDQDNKQLLSYGIASLGGDLTVNIKDKISIGKNGTGIYTNNGTVKVNDIEKIDVGSGMGALLHSNNGGNITFGSSLTKDIDVDGHFGFILEDNGIIKADETLKDKDLTFNVSNSGTGIMIANSNGKHSQGAIKDLGVGKLNLVLNGITPNPEKPKEQNSYTKGIYYKNLGKITDDLTNVNITNNGKNTVGVVLNGTYGDIKLNEIKITENANNSVGLLVKNNSDNLTNIQGNISVQDKNTNPENQTHGNIGIEAQNSSITTSGKIEVGEGYNFKNSYPVGAYLINTDKANKRYSYKGEGELKVGNFANGIVGSNYDIEYNGDILAGVGAIAINSQNNLYSELNKTIVNGKITIGDDSLPDREKGTGVFASNSDVIVNSPLMTLKTNKQNVGILSMEEGNVSFTGDVNIQGNEKVEKGMNSSMGIYKYGFGNLDINKGNWNVGTNSFGVIANSEIKNPDGDYIEEGIKITNDSNMDIKKGSVGIYSLGNNDLVNNGDIKITEGADKGDSSIGIYMENNKADKATGVNNGNILVSGKNSVGVQAVGNVEFRNNGKIDVINSGIGMFAAEGASIYNSKDGTINLGLDDAVQSEGTVGMYAKGENSTIINDGVINANNGIGMYVEDKATLKNNGVINLKNGIGIKGDGYLTNTGTIKIESGFGGVDIDDETDSKLSNDIIKINGNFAIIGSNYQNYGGTIESDVDLSLRNPTIDISSGKLGFDAPNISGGISLAPNFANMGNGYEISIPEFADKDVNLDVNTSPLFTGDLEKGDLTVHKVDYKDIMKDYQYQNFYNSMDKTLQSGAASDVEALKNLNSYLEGFGKTPEFYSEYERVMKDTRGSIYSHVQSRMQDINRAFENSFDEMESSYNLSKDTDKFSVIYTDGDYKNNNDLPNYDYNIAGLLYMKEFEDKDYNDKYGYTLGFTGSKFKFETIGENEENIYSLKGGVHNVKTFDRDLDMITKLELGLNYHDTERTTSYGANHHSNDADFFSYNVSLDNRFRKNLYQTYQNEFGVYFGTKLEYGRFTDIKEDGALALKVKGNDYLSAKAMAGINGTGRKYLGNDWTGKIIGDIGYSYDFGENYDANQSKLRNSNEGYVSLMNELETKGKATAKIGVGLERLNHLGVTLEGEVGQDFERDEDYWRVGLRFNYKFNQEDVVTTLRNTFNLFENHFDFDKHTLKPEEVEIVEAGSKIIDKYGLDGTLVFEGHTDSYGSVEYNQGLSERRANTVKKEVQNRVKTKNITYETKGYSELQPVDTNKTKQGRANNRRVQVKYLSK